MTGSPAPRLDRAWFDAAVFPVTTMIPTRFSDVDLQSHVNNVAVIALLQEGRVAFGHAFERESQGSLRPMVVGLVVEYAGELQFPGPVEIATGIVRVGRTSLTFAQRVRQAGRGAVYAEVTVVMTGDGRPQAIPPLLRTRLEASLVGPATA